MGINPDAAKASITSIGEKLKKARESRSLTIDQINKQTHINSEVLLALEEGRCDDILNTTYVKSFLKKYAGHLGLNANDILKEYAAAHQEKPAEPDLKVIGKVEEKASNAISYIYIAGLIFLLAAFLSVAVFLTKKASGSLKKAKPAVKATSLAPKPKAVTAPKAVQKKASSVKEGTVKASSSKQGQFYLTIVTKKPVFVKVKKDGVTLFGTTMPKGMVETLKAKEKIELYVAKAEAIELTLDGKPLGSPGTGTIAKLEITKNGIKIR